MCATTNSPNPHLGITLPFNRQRPYPSSQSTQSTFPSQVPAIINSNDLKAREVPPQTTELLSQKRNRKLAVRTPVSRDFHVSKMLTFGRCVPRGIITKPAWYRGFLLRTAKPNFFQTASARHFVPTSKGIQTAVACFRVRLPLRFAFEFYAIE